jgi:DNA replication protein DnaC
MNSNLYSIDKLWTAALDDYGVTQHSPEIQRLVKKITDDWKNSEPSDNQDGLLDYVEQELASFKAFRNPPRKSHRWSSERSESPTRSLRGRVCGGLKSLATGFKEISDLAGQGASIGFPPAGLIVAVVGHIAGACLAVSADYDLIEQLFSIMNSFAGRLRLLDNSIPNDGNYHKMISLVFCKMLEFCTNIRRSIEERKCRIIDFAKALFCGEDQKLREAYDAVLRQIDELDKATVMQTLAVAIGQANQLSRIDKESKEHFEHTWDLMASYSREFARRDEENKKGQMNMQKTIIQTVSGLIKPSGTTAKSASANTTTLESVTWSLSSGAEPYVTQQLKEVTQIRVVGTCDWVLNTEEYAEFRKRPGVLSISGGPGTGKSVLTATIFWRLKMQFESDSTTSVAFFTFDKNTKELRLLSNMLAFCAAQTARSDIGYGERIRAKIEEWDESGEKNSNQNLWEGLFEEQFKPSLNPKRTVYLVVDGADQLSQKSSADLASFIRRSAEYSLNVYFVVSGELNDELQGPLRKICLDKESIRKSGDFRRATIARLENFHNLSRLRPQLKRSIAENISKTADSEYTNSGDFGSSSMTSYRF